MKWNHLCAKLCRIGLVLCFRRVSVCVCVCMLTRFSCVQLYATLWTSSPPGSSVHGILQARILEWVAMPFSRGSSRPRDQTRVLCCYRIAVRFFTTETSGKPIHLYMCVFVYVYIYMWVCVCAHTYIHTCIYILVLMKMKIDRNRHFEGSKSISELSINMGTYKLC